MARRSSRRRKKRDSGISGQGLTAVSILSFVFFVLVLGAALVVTQFDMAGRLSTQQRAVAKSNAELAATRLTSSLSDYQNLMAGLVADPATQKALSSGKQKTMASREKQLKLFFPSALEVRLLRTGIKAVNTTLQPNLSYACLDMLREAESTQKAPSVEVHAYGKKQQHINFIQPILNKDGKQVIGHLQVILGVKLLQQWMDLAVINNYIELSQKAGDKKPLLVGKAGKSQYRSEENSTIKVEGSRWTIRAWAPAVENISIINLTFITVFTVAVVLMGLIVVMLRRSVSKTITADLESFTQLALSIMRGERGHQFPIKMSEFKDAVVRLHNMPMSMSMERERDHDPSSINLTTNKKMDVAMPRSDDSMMTSLDNIDKPTSGGGPIKKPEAKMAKSSFTAVETATTSDQLPAEIFKAYDIRGIVGKTLTIENIEMIGRAIGSEAASRGLKVVAFARDGRLSGPELSKALIKGIISTGINVLDVGMVPTPTLYYAAAEHAAGSGLMLTGSHNPPDYNGIKMVLGGETLSGDSIQALRQRIEKNDFTKGKGRYEQRDLTKEYIQRITSDVKVKRKLKIVIDCGNGVAGAIAPTLFKELGCDVTEMFCDVDGNFPNHHPDPSQPENLHDVINAVKANKADLGLAFDGDGDRIGVISGDGSVVWPDRLMMLFAEDVLKRNPSAQIIFDIKCSTNLMKHIWEKGGEPLMWKTGHSFIKAKMIQTGALLAGEMSGHIFFKERWYGFDDALYAAARLLEILSNNPRQPRVTFSQLPDAINTPELKIHMVEGEHYKFMDELLAKADFGDANVSMIDGMRADYADGWGLVRASNTTPCLVLRFEGQTDEAIKKVQSRFRETLLSIKPDLKLPF